MDVALEIRESDPLLHGKRRRLTVYDPINQRTNIPIPSSPTTPTVSRSLFFMSFN